MNLDELRAKLNEPKPWYYEIYLWFYRLWANKIAPFPREVKYFYQRGRYGFSSADVWGTDSYLIGIIPKMIRELMKQKNSYPAQPEEGVNSFEDWIKVLEKMAIGFERMDAWEDDYCAVMGEERPDFKDPNFTASFKAHEERVLAEFRESMGLFHKWFFHLWD